MGPNKAVALAVTGAFLIAFDPTCIASLEDTRSQRGSRGQRAADILEVRRQVNGTLVQIVASDGGLGSGFWIDQTHVATCWHVVNRNPSGDFTVQSAADAVFLLKENAKENVIITGNWLTFGANVVAKDELNDIAVLKVKGRNPFTIPPRAMDYNGKSLIHLSVASVEANLPELGEDVFLAGFPLGSPYLVFQPAKTASIAYDLPGFGRTVKILLSTVANPGNSGGPVFNSQGKVIGLLEGALPSRPGLDPAQAVSGLAVVVPAHYLTVVRKNEGDI